MVSNAVCAVVASAVLGMGLAVLRAECVPASPTTLHRAAGPSRPAE